MSIRHTADVFLQILTHAYTRTQSLVIPFALLIHNQRDTILALLEQIAVGDRSGLDVLINTWCENAETFQGFWPTRMNTLALCQLFASERPSLQQLTVKGDIIIKPETQNGESLDPFIPYLPLHPLHPPVVFFCESKNK